MKVKEMIEQLQKCDKEKDVVFLNNGDNPIGGEGYGISEIFEIKGSADNDYVFLLEN